MGFWGFGVILSKKENSINDDKISVDESELEKRLENNTTCEIR